MYFAFFKRHSHIKLPTINLFITFVFSLYLCNVNLTSASSNEDLSTQDLLLISLAKNEMTPVELEKLANAGDADAQFMLGSFHYFGKGVPSNKSIAMHWFEKASVNGNSKAQLMLGMMYDEGSEEIPKNKANAIKFYQTQRCKEMLKHNII